MMNLKPCRQCGGEAKLYKYRTYIKVKGRLDYKYYVSCQVCGHKECDNKGFGFLTEQEAINAWNRKAWQTIPLYKRRGRL